MASTTLNRANLLGTHMVEVDGVIKEAVKDFAIFIDTHRDQPHVGSFDDDVHRGTCRPTLIHLLLPDMSVAKVPLVMQDWIMWHAQTGQILPIDPKHKFVSVDWWGTFLVEAIADTGELPIDIKGFMPTSHLRDARAQKYKLRSFRQIVIERSSAP